MSLGSLETARRRISLSNSIFFPERAVAPLWRDSIPPDPQRRQDLPLSPIQTHYPRRSRLNDPRCPIRPSPNNGNILPHHPLLPRMQLRHPHHRAPRFAMFEIPLQASRGGQLAGKGGDDRSRRGRPGGGRGRCFLRISDTDWVGIAINLGSGWRGFEKGDHVPPDRSEITWGYRSADPDHGDVE